MMHHFIQMTRLKSHQRPKPWLLVAGLWMIVSPLVAVAENYSIPQWTMASGGQANISGGQWELSGTIGQWEAISPRALSGGQWHLTGGFWGAELEDRQPIIFNDRFQQTDSSPTSKSKQSTAPLNVAF